MYTGYFVIFTSAQMNHLWRKTFQYSRNQESSHWLLHVLRQRWNLREFILGREFTEKMYSGYFVIFTSAQMSHLWRKTFQYSRNQESSHWLLHVLRQRWNLREFILGREFTEKMYSGYFVIFTSAQMSHLWRKTFQYSRNQESSHWWVHMFMEIVHTGVHTKKNLFTTGDIMYYYVLCIMYYYYYCDHKSSICGGEWHSSFHWFQNKTMASQKDCSGWFKRTTGPIVNIQPLPLDVGVFCPNEERSWRKALEWFKPDYREVIVYNTRTGEFYTTSTTTPAPPSD